MKKTLFWPFAVILLTSLACNLPFSAGDGSGPSTDLPDAEANYFTADISSEMLLEPVDLSNAQRQVLTVRGAPNRFIIRFSTGMREETWYYDTVGYDVTFRNGDTYTENQGNPTSVELVLESTYNPWQFNDEMGLSELLAISSSEMFALETLEEVFEEEVSLVTLPGLIAGFRGETLLFVRAIPMASAQFAIDGEAQEMDDQMPAASNLTAAEQVHVGTHTYRIYCTYSDGTSEDIIEPITWAFTEDGVYYADEGPFPWIKENLYGVSDNEGELFIHFQDNVVTITGELIVSGADGEQDLVTFACAGTQE